MMEIRSNDSKVGLRTLGTPDADGLVAIANDQEVSYNMANISKIPYPFTKRNALIFIDMASMLQMENSALNFGIIHEGALVGAMSIKLDLENRNCEMGYWIGKDHRRKGFAKDAIRLALSFLFGTLKFNRVQAMALADNNASIKLMQELGFTKEGTRRQRIYLNGKFLDDVLFGILDGEFKSRVAYDVKE